MKRHNDKSIRDVVDLYLRGNQKLSEGYQSSRIDDIWREVMGKSIASYTGKIQLKGQTLLVEITSSPLKKELLMSPGKIIDLLNEAIGNDLVKDIKIY